MEENTHTHTHTHLNHFPLSLKLTQHFFRLFITQLCKSTTCVCVLVAQSHPTLCGPMDCSQPGSTVCGILQARILDSLLQGIFSTQESNPRSPTLQADSLPSEPPGMPIHQLYFNTKGKKAQTHFLLHHRKKLSMFTVVPRLAHSRPAVSICSMNE